MRENRHLESRTDVHLERPQLIWLTLGSLVLLGLVFALGVVVGRRDGRLQAAQALANATSADPGGPSDSASDLTFYDALTESPRRRDRVLAAKPRSARLPRKDVHAAESKPQAAAQVERMGRGSPAALQAALSEAGEPDLGSRLAGAVARVRQARSPSELPEQMNNGPARRGDYTVQVSAFQNRTEAQAYAAGLERRGYKPFIVRSVVEGKGTWYRVRLGRFPNIAAANQAKEHLAQNAIAAWVLRSP